MQTRFKKSGRIDFCHAARFLFQPLVDFIFPPFCHICHSSVKAEHYPICQRCLDALERIEPVALDAHHYISPLQNQFVFSHTIAAFTYSKALQKMIHDFKYNGFSSLAKPLGNILGQVCCDCPEFADIDYIIPVPLHISRYRERGYNQAELLARQIAAVNFVTCMPNNLIRTRNTRQQVKCNADERLKNVQDAFTVKNPEHIKGAKIALVDDVLTTGGTMNECAKTLKKAGALQMIAVTCVRISS